MVWVGENPDNAVAEPAAIEGRVAVVPATFGNHCVAHLSFLVLIGIVLGWGDVGDFSSLADLLPAEANQPRILGDNNLGTEHLFPNIGIFTIRIFIRISTFFLPMYASVNLLAF